MDQDRLDLIRQLMTRAGMMLEDISAEAVLLPSDLPALSVTVERLGRRAGQAMSLIEAAQILVRQS